MKILFLSMHYRPEPCDSRTSELAALMAARGHQATALTSFPNYPFGKVYEGHRQRLCQKERIEGVEVVRVPMFPDHSRSRKRRALSYLSFGFSAAFLGVFFTKRPDLIWIHHPPLTTGIAGYLLAKLKRVPYVYEIHDLWPETLTSCGMIREGRITRAIQRVCAFLHKRAAAIVVTSPGMREHLERQGVDPAKVHVIYQWTPHEEAALTLSERSADFSPEWSADFSPHPGPRTSVRESTANAFTVMFTGNMGAAQALDTVLDAAKLLASNSDVQVVMAGAGMELARLQARASEEGIENIHFTGQLTHDELLEHVASADGLLVHLKDDPLFEITVPSKTQFYMARGKPILCGVAGDTSHLVSQANAGITFAPQDPAAMANAILQLRALPESDRVSMGANARQAYRILCCKQVLAERYERLFLAVLGEPHTAAVLSEEHAPAFEPAREAA